MIKEIVKDDFFLAQPSADVTANDLYIADDLLDTIKAHQQTCLGMAANMIGYLKRMMVVLDEDHYLLLINPQILKTGKSSYMAKEGCLCHQGTKTLKRYEQLKIAYLDRQMKKRIRTFSGLTAQIIQHELDHFEGKLI